MATQMTFPNSAGPKPVAKRIADTDTTTILDVYDNSAGTTAMKIEALAITTTNTADRIVSFYNYIGSTAYLHGSVSVTQLSGTNGATTPRKNVLATLGTAGPDGVPVIWVFAGCKLQAGVDSALAAGKVLDIIGRAIPYN